MLWILFGPQKTIYEEVDQKKGFVNMEEVE